jgi:hypothetical protein
VKAARKAGGLVADNDGDRLVVLPPGMEVPGAQDDDDVNAIAAIDLLRWLVYDYDTREQEGPQVADQFTADEIETLVRTAGEAVFGDLDDLSQRQRDLASRAFDALNAEGDLT